MKLVFSFLTLSLLFDIICCDEHENPLWRTFFNDITHLPSLEFLNRNYNSEFDYVPLEGFEPFKIGYPFKQKSNTLNSAQPQPWICFNDTVVSYNINSDCYVPFILTIFFIFLYKLVFK